MHFRQRRFRRSPATWVSDESLRLKLIAGLGHAASRMVTGQQLDLEAEGKELAIDEVKNIHANKTGALIEFLGQLPAH
jgi:geranylgeranyl pyrophosphate synthase